MLLKSLRFFSPSSAKRKEQKADYDGTPKSDKEHPLANKSPGTKEPLGLANADPLPSPSLSMDRTKSPHSSKRLLTDRAKRNDISPLFSNSTSPVSNLPPPVSFQPEEAATMHTVQQQQQQQRTPQKPSSFGSRFLWNLDIESTDDLAAVRPPSALLPGYGASDTELADSPVRRPAGLREPLLRMPSLQSSESADSVVLKQDSPAMSLEEEMPPLSPFFSRIPDSDILEARDAVRRASVSRRNTLSSQPETPGSIHHRLHAHAQKQRDTWCVPPPLALAGTGEGQKQPGVQRYSARMSLSGAMDRWTAMAPAATPWKDFDTPSKQQQQQQQQQQRGREDPLSLFALETALEEVEWLVNQEPPMSPIFDGYEFSPNAGSVKLEEIHKRNRYFQVDVYSLLSPHAASARKTASSNNSQFRVVVGEISNGRLSEVMDAADDPDVQLALRHHPWVLHQLRRCSMKAAESGAKQTAMRMPTRLRTHTLCTSRRCIRPVLSFTASSSRAVRSDRCVRAINVDSMVAAYLPRIHALLLSNELPTVEARRAESTVSETSAATLAENKSSYPARSTHSLLLSPKEEFRQPTSSTPTPTPTPASFRPPSLSSIDKLARRSDLGPSTAFSAAKTLSAVPRGAAPRQLRATASVLNMRASSMEARDASYPGGLNTARLPAPSRSMQLMRRRSEIPATAKASADAPLAQIRRQSAFEPGALGIGATSAPARRIRSPPQAMFSTTAYSSLDSGSQPLRAANTVSPRTSGLLSPSSRMSLSSDCSYDSPLASRSTLVSSIHGVSGRNRLASKQPSQMDLAGRKGMGKPNEPLPAISSGRGVSVTPNASSAGMQKKPQRSSIQFPTPENSTMLERRRGTSGAPLPLTAWQQSPTPSLQKSNSLTTAATAAATANSGGCGRGAVNGNKSKLCLPSIASPQSLATSFGSGPKSAPARNAFALDPVSSPLKLPILRNRPTGGKRPDVRDLFFNPADDEELVLRPL